MRGLLQGGFAQKRLSALECEDGDIIAHSIVCTHGGQAVNRPPQQPKLHPDEILRMVQQQEPIPKRLEHLKQRVAEGERPDAIPFKELIALTDFAAANSTLAASTSVTPAF